MALGLVLQVLGEGRWGGRCTHLWGSFGGLGVVLGESWAGLGGVLGGSWEKLEPKIDQKSILGRSKS